LLATSTAMAPAFSAFLTLTSNSQVPRSTSAILPVYAPAGDGLQPSVGDAVPSLTSTRLPVKLAAVAGGPNEAVA
jgi:hypothetical protein